MGLRKPSDQLATALIFLVLPLPGRVGRTGRAGNKGTAITFISEEEDRYAPDLVKALKESNAPIPQDLQTLADGFRDKVKAGLVQHHGSGYGGTGFKFNDTEDDAFKQLRKAKAKELRGADDTHDAPSSDSDDGAVIRRAGTSAAPSLGNGTIVAVGDAAASAAANALATAVQQAAMAASSNPVIAAAQALAAKLTAQAAAGLAPSAAAALQSHYGVVSAAIQHAYLLICPNVLGRLCQSVTSLEQAGFCVIPKLAH